MLLYSPRQCQASRRRRATWLVLLLTLLLVASATVSSAARGRGPKGGRIQLRPNAQALRRAHSATRRAHGAKRKRTRRTRRTRPKQNILTTAGKAPLQRSEQLRSDISAYAALGDEALAERVFAKGKKYFWVPRDTFNWCGGESHFYSVLNCMLAEASFLRRILVLDPILCIPGAHNFGRREWKNMELYYNLDRIFSVQPGMTQKTFERAEKAYKRMSNKSTNPVTRENFRFEDAPRVLQRSNATLVTRKFRGEQYYPFVCHREGMTSPLEGHRADALLRIVDSIAQALEHDFDTVHVRRGDKVQQCAPDKCWPHLDHDTRPEQLVKKLPSLIPAGRRVYIGTNERTPGFFDSLKKLYMVYLLRDFSYLWNKTSEWHVVTSRMLGADATFDVRMQAIIDYEVFQRGKRKIDTFPDLTSDPKNGCKKPTNVASRHGHRRL